MAVLDETPIDRAIRLRPRAQALNALSWVRADPLAVAARGGPLAGIPIVVKDNIDVRGAPTTAGTPALADHIANDDAPCVRLLENAGAVVVAKTRLHELALGATSINPAFGAVLNPFDPDYTAGGSSGGSAAAVAVGMTPLAIGTDTSGSCRVPAACCGIVGFRPSLDRYPIDRVVPISLNRDTVGLLARDMAQVIAADAVLASGRRETVVDPGRIRLGVPRALAADLSRAVNQAFQAATRRLLAAGIEVVECELPSTPDILWATQVAVITFDMPLHLATYLLRSGSDLDVPSLAAQVCDPIVKRRLEAMLAEGPDAAPRHAAALETMRRLRRDVTAMMRTGGLTALFYPTLVTAAPRVSEARSIEVDGQTLATGPTLLRNTLLASLIGTPSLSLPIGHTPGALPVGALLDGFPGRDADLLALGARLEPILNSVEPG